MVALTPLHLEAIEAVAATWPSAPRILIGALALGSHIDLIHRHTDDLDLAVAVSPDAFPGALGERPGWSRDAYIEHRFLGPGRQTVDVIPAGPEAVARGAIEWSGGRQMSLIGFDLAFAHADVVTQQGVSFGLPSAPALALLKMRAWLDRPFEREKDLGDLAHLLHDYVADDDERRWGGEVREELTFEDVSPFLLGRDLGRIAKPHHVPHVQLFTEKVTVAALGAFGPWSGYDLEPAERALDAFDRGFRGRAHP